MESLYSLDRIEHGKSEDIAVFVPDEKGRKSIELPLTLSESLAREKLKEGDVCKIDFDGDSPISVTPLHNETESRKKSAADRLSALFKRNKK